MSGAKRTHLLTVAVEEYFHATALNPLISERHWTRLESRVFDNTQRTLDLLDEYGIRATFFVLGWIAERQPVVVREITARGHEVACKGHQHRSLQQMSRDGFREDVRRAREALEDAVGTRVIGYRVPQGSFGLDDLWALRVLAEEGFSYDSSIYPLFRSIAREPWRRFPHTHHCGEDLEILEFPLSTWGTDAFLFRTAGGNYVRQLPAALMRRAFAHWDEHYRSPFNMYFHVWELDPELPRIAPAGPLRRVRQYRNLRKMPERLREYFGAYAFQGIGDLLGTAPELLPARRPEREPSEAPASDVQGPDERPPVTIVIPCFDEERVLPYLANTLDELTEALRSHYRVRFVLVDDASRDATWDTMESLFAGRPGYDLVRHPSNRGVAAAIQTGLRRARTEIVCSIDADCSYDPRQLEAMIPLLEDGVAMVTASPYHPLGSVENVSGLRLFLSKTLSRLYRVVLHHGFATYTSCFRVYRRSAVVEFEPRHGGFLGVAEMLGLLDLEGARLAECPAVLEARMLGGSKMSTLRTIFGHLGLLCRLAVRRLTHDTPEPVTAPGTR